MNSFDELIDKVIGGCHIERQIGQGGMGAVFKAHHLALDIPVALKLLLPSASLNLGGSDRFLQEARAAAKLRHPAIIGVLGVGADQGFHYIIMEFCDGLNLSTLIEESKKGISIPEAIKIAEQILCGVDYAHKNRIIHRDIKPENILIFQSGEAKLADLGLAKDLNKDTTLTHTSMTLGSPHYIAPEQAENPRRIDGRADLYSVGCTLFHMITGTPPYSGSSSIEVILNHIQSPVPDVVKLCPELKDSIAAVIYKLMEKDPEKRFQCAADARVALMDAYQSQRSAIPVKDSVIKKGNQSHSFFKNKLQVILSLVIVSLIFTLALILTQQHPSRETSTERKSVNNSKDTSTHRTEIGARQAGEPVTVLSAVNNEDNENLSRLLDRGVSPNAQNGAMTSPLHQAVIRQSIIATSLLLDKGANPSFQDNYKDTPLHYALRSGSIELVKLLLSKGSNPNIGDRFNQSPLQISKDLNRKDLIQLLKQYGANL
jgi:serine/threonine protein kinase